MAVTIDFLNVPPIRGTLQAKRLCLRHAQTSSVVVSSVSLCWNIWLGWTCLAGEEDGASIHDV